MYDIYGSLDELECFTEAVNRWEMTIMVDLPENMQICYDAMHKFVNEIVGDVSKDHGLNTFPYVIEEWVVLQPCFIPIFSNGSELIHWSSLITRLSDDLGTYEAESKRGDVAKSTLCYIVREGISEVQAKHCIKELISSS
nr:putative terpene synthase 9 [Quercus suber]